MNSEHKKLAAFVRTVVSEGHLSSIPDGNRFLHAARKFYADVDLLYVQRADAWLEDERHEAHVAALREVYDGYTAEEEQKPVQEDTAPPSPAADKVLEEMQRIYENVKALAETEDAAEGEAVEETEETEAEDEAEQEADEDSDEE